MRALRIPFLGTIDLEIPRIVHRGFPPKDPSILVVKLQGIGLELMLQADTLNALAVISDDLALELAREKLANTVKAGADCIATLCPFCFVALDLGQLQIKSKFKEEFDMPVLHYSELLSLALGIDPGELALESHKVKTDKLISKIS